MSQSPSERGSGSTAEAMKAKRVLGLNPLLNGALVQQSEPRPGMGAWSQSPSERGSGSTAAARQVALLQRLAEGHDNALQFKHNSQKMSPLSRRLCSHSTSIAIP